MKPDSPGWMPDLCRPRSLFGILVAVELVVLAAVLLRPSTAAFALSQLATASLLALWLALTCSTVLCQLRARIVRLPMPAGITLALLLPVGIVGAATWVVARLDQELGLGFSVAAESTRGFVLACMAVTLLLAAAVLRYAYVAEQWQRQQAAASRAQVEALQARIRPHFLFNAMNTIAGLIRHDPVAAEHAVEDLSELFRAALGGGAGPSTLGEELHLARRYLALEAQRLGPRLKVDWDLAEDLPLGLALPRLILQPLAENAITHGIARLPNGGTLEFGARCEGRSVLVRLRNPLAPRQPAVHGNQHAQESIALRLAHHFEHRARMVTESREGYYSVTLQLPMDAP